MHALVTGLVLPGDASMYVMSTLETARELIRHSSYRYEFATVAVTDSLFALEHVLAERWRSTHHSRASSSMPATRASSRPSSPVLRVLLRETAGDGQARSSPLPPHRAR
ncbi:hypothetical protein ABZX93_10155 [Streptomyces sp. NPDC006632]|uniref:hypothetical protein n=1 Tax=Streptomyces sp. NPDC006632 TaxID=3157182 RepID=UPI0033ADE323